MRETQNGTAGPITRRSDEQTLTLGAELFGSEKEFRHVPREINGRGSSKITGYDAKRE